MYNKLKNASPSQASTTIVGEIIAGKCNFNKQNQELLPNKCLMTTTIYKRVSACWYKTTNAIQISCRLCDGKQSMRKTS